MTYIVSDICSDLQAPSTEARQVSGDDTSYRFSRNGARPCVNGANYRCNHFYLQFNPVKHNVECVCTSRWCGDGKRPGLLKYVHLAQQWAALENPPVFDFDLESDEELPTTTANTAAAAAAAAADTEIAATTAVPDSSNSKLDAHRTCDICLHTANC